MVAVLTDEREIVLLHQILGRQVMLAEGVATVVLGWPSHETIVKPAAQHWYLRVVYPGGTLATVRVDELPPPLELTCLDPPWAGAQALGGVSAEQAARGLQRAALACSPHDVDESAGLASKPVEGTS